MIDPEFARREFEREFGQDAYTQKWVARLVQKSHALIAAEVDDLHGSGDTHTPLKAAQAALRDAWIVDMVTGGRSATIDCRTEGVAKLIAHAYELGRSGFDAVTP